MFALGVEFPTGRYHATPWGAAPNEGLVEWPPSHWRMIRAMISAWKSRRISGGGDVIRPLADSAPTYWVPPASLSHKRHYMQVNDSPTMVIDGFAAVGDGRLVAMWPNVSLNKRQLSVMRRILDGIPYLGRAESRVRIRICEPRTPNCVPMPDVRADGEIIDTLLVRKGSALDGWGIKSVSATTATLQAERMALPPAAVPAQYVRLGGSAPYTAPAARSTARRACVVRFGLGGSPPHISMAAAIGRLAKSRILTTFGKRTGAKSETLSGHRQDGSPLGGPHLHAHYLPTAEGGTRIDHITVVAPGGLSPDELSAVRGTRALSFRRTRLHMVFQGYGAPDNFRHLGMFGVSRTWNSSTPYIPPLHMKRRSGRRRGIRRQVERELRSRYGLRSVAVVAYDAENTPAAAFHVNAGHGRVGDGGPTWLRLEFDQSVAGPLTLGYGSHVGLGMFMPGENA